MPDDPADFHALRGKAAVQALETALDPEAKKYRQGVDIAQRWIGGDHSQTASPEVDLAIRFLGGEAALAYVKDLPPTSLEQSGVRTEQTEWARQQFNIVAATAGPYQAKAKLCLLDPALGPAAKGEPGTFADARIRAKAALDRFLAARAEQAEAARSGAGNDLDAQRQRRQQMDTAQREALTYCRLALDLRTAATAPEEVDDAALLPDLSPLCRGRPGRGGRAGRRAGAKFQRVARSPPGGKDRFGCPRGLVPPGGRSVAGDGRRATASPGRKDHPTLERSLRGRRRPCGPRGSGPERWPIGKGRPVSATDYGRLTAAGRSRVEPRPGAMATGTVSLADFHLCARPHGGGREDDNAARPACWGTASHVAARQAAAARTTSRLPRPPVRHCPQPYLPWPRST